MGTFAATGDADCAACTAVTNGVTLTCTTAANSEVASCAAGFWKDTTGAADVCTACATVTGALTAATYTCTTASDSRVSACAAAATTKKTVGADGATDTCTDVCGANTWDNSNVCTALTICGTQLKVGTADAVARLKGTAAVTTGLATANNVCDACIAGTYAADDATNCVACATVTNALVATTDPVAAGATYTCTTPKNSRVSACAAAHWRDNSGQADKCTAHTACGKQVKVGDADAAVRTASTAASATADAVCAVCTAGTYGTNSGDCNTCATVDGAMAASGTGVTPVVAAATYTCTTNSDSRVSACATATSKKTVGADGATDTCTATCAVAGTWDKEGICTACTAAANAATTTCSATGTDSVAASCNDGFWKDGDKCTACTAADPVVANAMYTCGSANAPTSFQNCKDGFFKNAAGDACTACTAIANAGSITCTSATAINFAGIVCNDGFESNSKSSVTFTCTACDAIANTGVTCTWPGNSVFKSCNTGFDDTVTTGVCAATKAVVPDAPPPPPAATPAATAATPSASLSAA